MKKLLALVLVLAMAPMASAALTLVAPTEAAPGDTIEISLVTTGGEAVSSVVLALVTDNGAGGTANAPGTWNSGFNLSTDGGYNGAAWGYAAGDLLGATGEADAGASATGTLFTYTYTIASDFEGLIEFTIEDVPGFGMFSVAYDTDAATLAMAGTCVNVVPEPMTIALLGLGGLFLRRRRS